MDKKLKKEITFIYMDTSEKQQFNSIAKEAKKRGYKVFFTTNKFQKCEIGFYCQHINFPQFSKFSVVMLHDIIQQYDKWPDLWYREPWNKYDIGILPGKIWEDMWKISSINYYAKPKKNIYTIGWPKADILKNLNIEKQKIQLLKKYNMDCSKPTILYAPAWENDNKQTEFINSVKNLPVNILIKQAHVNKNLFPKTFNNIKQMKELYKDTPGIYQLNEKTNIIDAIILCDILVSEESSTMCEAVMLGKPAVSVTNWLIPDVIPSRYVKNCYDFAISTKKENLEKTIANILHNYEKYEAEAKLYSLTNFKNIGKSGIVIMDLIDSIINNTPFYISPSIAKNSCRLHIKKYLNHNIIKWKTEIVHNYSKRYKFINFLYCTYKFIKGSSNEQNI